MKKRNLGRKGLAILLSLTIVMSMMPTAVFASGATLTGTDYVLSGDGTLEGGTVITNEDGSQTVIPSSSDSALSDADTADDNGKAIVNEDENGTDAVGSDSNVDADANDADAAGTDSDTGSGSAATAPAGSESAPTVGTPTVGDMALNSVLNSFADAGSGFEQSIDGVQTYAIATQNGWDMYAADKNDKDISSGYTINLNDYNAGDLVARIGFFTFGDFPSSEVTYTATGIDGSPLEIKYDNDPNNFNFKRCNIYIKSNLSNVEGAKVTISLSSPTTGNYAAKSQSFDIIVKANPQWDATVTMGSTEIFNETDKKSYEVNYIDYAGGSNYDTLGYLEINEHGSFLFNGYKTTVTSTNTNVATIINGWNPSTERVTRRIRIVGSGETEIVVSSEAHDDIYCVAKEVRFKLTVNSSYADFRTQDSATKSARMMQNLGGGSVTWDQNTKTLTLENISYEIGDSNGAGYGNAGVAIALPDGATVKYKGENSIKVEDSWTSPPAVFFFNGAGNLASYNESSAFDKLTITGDCAPTIIATGDLKLTGGTLDIDMSTEKSLILYNSGVIYSNGGNITFSEDNYTKINFKGPGVADFNPDSSDLGSGLTNKTPSSVIYATGDVSVLNSKIDMDAEFTGKSGSGIFSKQNNILIKNATVNANIKAAMYAHVLNTTRFGGNVTLQSARISAVAEGGSGYGDKSAAILTKEVKQINIKYMLLRGGPKGKAIDSPSIPSIDTVVSESGCLVFTSDSFDGSNPKATGYSWTKPYLKFTKDNTAWFELDEADKEYDYSTVAKNLVLGTFQPVVPSEYKGTITYSSSDSGLVAVDSNGKLSVNAKGKTGKATITVSASADSSLGYKKTSKSYNVVIKGAADFTNSKYDLDRTIQLLNKGDSSKASWNSETKTLKLNGIDYKSASSEAAIVLPAGAIVEVVGTNTLSLADGSGNTGKIMLFKGAATIKGSGMLKFTGDAVGAICCAEEGELSITDTSVDINIKNTGDETTNCGAIYASNGTITLTDVKMTANYESPAGSVISSPKYTSGKIVITGGEYTLSATASKQGYVIYTCNLEMQDVKFTASYKTTTQEELYWNGASAAGAVILVKAGTLSVKDGTMSLSAEGKDAKGICSTGPDNGVILDGCEIVATSENGYVLCMMRYDAIKYTYNTGTFVLKEDITGKGIGVDSYTQGRESKYKYFKLSSEETKDWIKIKDDAVSTADYLTDSDLGKVFELTEMAELNSGYVKYTSSDKEIATVDRDGNIKLANKGKIGDVTITVTSEGFSYSTTGSSLRQVFAPCTLSHTIKVCGHADFTDETYVEKSIELLTQKGGTAEWKSENNDNTLTNTLTLSGVDFTAVWDDAAVKGGNKYQTVMLVPANTSIVLNGDNVLSGDKKYSGKFVDYGIASVGNEYTYLAVKGEGKLDISGCSSGIAGDCNLNVTSGTINIRPVCRSNSEGNCSIGIDKIKGKLNITGGNINIVTDEEAANSASKAVIPIMLEQTGMSISGGKLNISHRISKSSYINQYYSGAAIVSADSVIVSGGELKIETEVSGDDANIIATGICIGEATDNTNLTVSGGKLNINIKSSGGRTTCGVYIPKKDVNISGGNVNIRTVSGTSSGNTCYAYGIYSDYGCLNINGGYTLINSDGTVFYGKNISIGQDINNVKVSPNIDGAVEPSADDFYSYNFEYPIKSFKATELNDSWSENIDLSPITLFYSQDTYSIELDLGAYDGEVNLSSSDESLFTLVEDPEPITATNNIPTIKINKNSKTGKGAKLIIDAPTTSTCEGKKLEIKVNILPMVRYGFDDDDDRANAFLTKNGGTASWNENTKTLTIKDINAKGCIILPSEATLKIEGSNTMGAASDNTIRTQNGVIGIGNLTVSGEGKLQINDGSMLAGNLTIDGGEITVPTLAAITKEIAENNTVLKGLFEAGDLSPLTFTSNLQSHKLTIDGGTISVTNRVYANDSFCINGGSFKLKGKFSKATVNDIEYKSAAPYLAEGVWASYGSEENAMDNQYTNENDKDKIYNFACIHFQATENSVTLTDILGTDLPKTLSYCDGSVSLVLNLPNDWADYNKNGSFTVSDSEGLITGTPTLDVKDVAKFDASTGAVYNVKEVSLKFNLNDKCKIGETTLKLELEGNEKYADAEAEWTFTVTGEADFTKKTDRAIALINAAHPDVAAGVVEIKELPLSQGSEEITPSDSPRCVLLKGIQNFDAPIIVSGVDENNRATGYYGIMLKGESNISELKGYEINICEDPDEDGAHSLHTGDITANSVTLCDDVSMYVNGSIDSTAITFNGGTLTVASEGTLFKNGVPSISDAVKAKSWAVLGEKTDGSAAVMVKDLANIGYNADKHHYFKLSSKAETTPITYTVSFNANGGSGNMSDVNIMSGEYTLPENGFTAPTDKKFKGWATSANGDVLSGTKINVTANTTLYAIWEAKETGGSEEQEKALIAGTVESFDTVLNNAVIRLYSANRDDATIRSDMRDDRSQALAAYTDKLTLGAESLSGSKNVTHKQSFEIKDVEQGEYKLAVYKAKRDGKDPYVVSIVKVTVGEDGTVSFEGNDSNIKMWLYGDVTWDGTINASDAEQVLRYATPGKTSKVIIGKDTSCEGTNQFEAADITKDGSLNASDAEQILRYATPGKTSKKFEEITN